MRRRHKPLNIKTATPTFDQQEMRRPVKRPFRTLIGGRRADPEALVNFKVFNFTNGSLVWEKLLNQYAYLATDGSVYHITDELLPNTFVVDLSELVTSASLPNRIATGSNRYIHKAERFSAAAGTLLNTSAEYEIGGLSGPLFAEQLLRASTRAINDAGLMSFPHPGGTVSCAVVSPNSTTTALTYYIWTTGVRSGNVRLTSNPATSMASWAVGDSTATAQSAIATAFGAAVTSVTCSGQTVREGMMKIVIDWAVNTSYLAQISTSSAVQYGGFFVRNMRTGVMVTGPTTAVMPTSSTYQRPGIWDSAQNLVRIDANPSNATQARVSSWNTSTDPCTVTWSEQPLNSFTVAVSGSTKGLSGLCAAQGKILCGFPLMGTGGNFYSGKSWNNDGTGGQLYGAAVMGYSPIGHCIADDSTAMTVISRNWDMVASNGLHSVTSQSYSDSNGTPQQIFSAAGSVTEYLNTGAVNTVRVGGDGFDATAVAAISGIALVEAGTVTRADGSDGTPGKGRIDYTTQTQPTGFSDPFLPTDMYEVNYYLNSPPNFLGADYEWRLRWATAGEQTAWMAEDITLANLNVELLSVFGSDVESNQNVTADQWDTPPTTVTTPAIWQRIVRINCRCARNSTEATASGQNLSLSAATYAAIKPLILEVRNYTSIRTAKIAAVKRSDGSQIWARGFRLSVADSTGTTIGALHSGKLYCFSASTVPSG